MIAASTSVLDRSWAWVATAAVAIVSGWALAFSPLAAALPLVVGLALLLVASAWARALVMVLGGALLLGGSQEFTATKASYFPLAAMAFVFATIRVFRSWDRVPREWRISIGIAAVWMGWVAISFLIAKAGGVPVVAWVRDALPYALLSAAVVFAVDLGLVASERVLRRVIIVVGVLAAVGLAVSWLNRRGVSAIGLERVFIPSDVLAALGVVASAVVWLRGTNRLLGLIAFSLSTAAVMLPGSRSNITYVLAVLAIFGSTQVGAVPWRKFWTALLPVTVAAFVLVLAGAKFLIADQTFLQERLRAALVVAESGVQADLSGIDRIVAFRNATATWREHPLVGAGPGTIFYKRYGLEVTQLDSPLMVGAKFGLVGAVLLTTLVVVLLLVLRAGATPARVTWPMARALAVACLLSLPFGGPFEDKGLGYAVVLLGALSIAESRPRGLPRLEPDASEPQPQVGGIS